MVAYAGFFDDVGKAKGIVQTLKDKNYSDGEVLLIEPATGDDLKKSLSYAKNRDYITKGIADKAAAGLANGRSLLVVKARLGDGLMVERLYDENGEMLSASSESTRHVFFSDLIGMPLLAQPPKASSQLAAHRPFTERFGMMIVQKRGQWDSSMGLPLKIKPLMTGSFLPLSAKPLMTSFFPMLFNKSSDK